MSQSDARIRKRTEKQAREKLKKQFPMLSEAELDHYMAQFREKMRKKLGAWE